MVPTVESVEDLGEKARDGKGKGTPEDWLALVGDIV